MYICYFEYFGNAWPCPSNKIVPTSRKRWYLTEQKINFIPHLFLEILDRFCKFVLGTLVLTGHAHQNWWYQLLGKFEVYVYTNKLLHHSLLSWNNFKDIANLLFWILWTCLTMANKDNGISLWKWIQNSLIGLKRVISTENAGKVTAERMFLSVVSRKGVGNNSILCQFCQDWLHKRFTGMRVKLKEDINLNVRHVQISKQT